MTENILLNAFILLVGSAVFTFLLGLILGGLQ